MTRIAITGGPLTGKTTLAKQLSADLQLKATEVVEVAIRHTDHLISLGWSEASAASALWFDEEGPWIIEGVAVPRALRKWRDAHPGQRPPVDRVIYLSEPHQVCMRGQSTMAKGVESVFRELEPWLEEHDVDVEYR